VLIKHVHRTVDDLRRTRLCPAVRIRSYSKIRYIYVYSKADDMAGLV